MSRESIKRALADAVGSGMTCKEFVKVATDYLDGALSFIDSLRSGLHQSICPGCRRYLRQMKRTIHTLGRLPVPPMSPLVRIELIQRFRARKLQSARATWDPP